MIVFFFLDTFIFASHSFIHMMFTQFNTLIINL